MSCGIETSLQQHVTLHAYPNFQAINPAVSLHVYAWWVFNTVSRVSVEKGHMSTKHAVQLNLLLGKNEVGPCLTPYRG